MKIVVRNRDDEWDIQVQHISRIHKSIDSTTIVKNDGAVKLKVGDDFETINCVLPLFDNNDGDLQPLISSQLFKILMN